MTTGSNGEGAASPRVVLQRARASKSRQVRSIKSPRVDVGVAAAAPSGKDAGQRRVARVRQARTVMQRRPQTALFTPFPVDIDIDIDIVIKMALRSNARRSQLRQLNVLRSPSLPLTRAAASFPVIKTDVARVAQGRQLSASKLSARPTDPRK